jgi:uncharacterized membrane protein
MDDVWTLVRFLHLLGVVLWIGGIVMLGAVVVPAARMAGDRAAGRRVMVAAARRYGIVGAVAWILIAVTGMGLLDHRGLSLGDLPDTDYGQRLLAKICLLLAMGVVAVLHGAWQGPRVGRALAAGDEAGARRWRVVGAGFDALLLLGSLAALWLATSLVA